MHILTMLVALASMPPALGADSVPTPTVRVCGVDASASVRSVERLQQHCARVVQRARAGDVVIVRWISDSSFRSIDEILAVRMPGGGAVCTNPYDSKCRRAAASALRRFEHVRDSATRVVVGAVSPSSRRTDIYGFFAAAAARLADLPSFRNRVIYVTGDLRDTAGQRSKVDLSGAQVVLYALETDGNIAAGVGNRNAWVNRLREWKVGAVTTCLLVDEEC